MGDEESAGVGDEVEVAWLTVRQVAERLGISVRVVYDRIGDGRLKAYNFGGEGQRALWRVDEEEVARFVRESEHRLERED